MLSGRGSLRYRPLDYLLIEKVSEQARVFESSLVFAVAINRSLNFVEQKFEKREVSRDRPLDDARSQPLAVPFKVVSFEPLTANTEGRWHRVSPFLANHLC